MTLFPQSLPPIPTKKGLFSIPLYNDPWHIANANGEWSERPLGIYSIFLIWNYKFSLPRAISILESVEWVLKSTGIVVTSGSLTSKYFSVLLHLITDRTIISVPWSCDLSNGYLSIFPFNTALQSLTTNIRTLGLSEINDVKLYVTSVLNGGAMYMLAKIHIFKNTIKKNIPALIIYGSPSTGECNPSTKQDTHTPLIWSVHWVVLGLKVPLL